MHLISISIHMGDIIHLPINYLKMTCRLSFKINLYSRVAIIIRSKLEHVRPENKSLLTFDVRKRLICV